MKVCEFATATRGVSIDECRVIWSEEHARWWREGGVGYTHALAEAGVYSQDAAAGIVERANITGFNEVAIALTPEILAAVRLGPSR